MNEADVIRYDGHSDYGSAFGVFADKFAQSMTARSSLLILGDGCNNYRHPNLAALQAAGFDREALALA